ncbi:DUF4163 domain-containing protein [Lacrimispora sp. BS-2]|uniref:DUF4163 domain-containing protein n=1 Tax=Lacrimispora sp. BS-2 TaxID=3151850 RepID=A0AAU7PKK4_9FIRM
MKRNPIFTIAIVIIAISLIACNSSNIYEVKKNNYEETNENFFCNIEYPSISGLNDQENQKKINTILKNEALKVLNYYTDSFGFTELAIGYQITFSNKSILSIQFSGTGNVDNAAHPNNLFYTVNIDIQEGTKLRLSDIVEINSDFVDKLYNGDFEALWHGQGEYISNYSKNDMLRYLKDADSLDNIGSGNQSDVFSYFTPDGLGISIPVSHSIGDHAEFEIKYSDLKKHMKVKPE